MLISMLLIIGIILDVIAFINILFIEVTLAYTLLGMIASLICVFSLIAIMRRSRK